jgi:hypothetical protein
MIELRPCRGWKPLLHGKGFNETAPYGLPAGPEALMKSCHMAFLLVRFQGFYTDVRFQPQGDASANPQIHANNL